MKRLALISMISPLVLLAPWTVWGDHTKDSLETIERNLTKRRAILVDCREHNETDKGYVDGAILVPLSLLQDGSGEKEFQQVLAQRLPPKAIVYLYCASGGRCVTAASILNKFGYDARPLKHGFEDLAQEGFVTAKPKR